MTQNPMTPDPSRDAVVTRDEERTWAVLAHVSALVAAVVSAGWLSFIGPLVVWALYKDKSAFVRQSAAAAFNFNVLLWIASIAAWILVFTVIGIPLALILWLGVFVASIVFHLLAALAANRGEVYRYPWNITILR